MKKFKIIFWITTTFLFIFEGLLPVLTVRSSITIQTFAHLGYPLYFVVLLTVFKVLGSLVLIIPQVPVRVKEWAYAGFAFDFISAFVSIVVVDGLNGMAFAPIITMIILVVSYLSYNKLKLTNN